MSAPNESAACRCGGKYVWVDGKQRCENCGSHPAVSEQVEACPQCTGAPSEVQAGCETCGGFGYLRPQPNHRSAAPNTHRTRDTIRDPYPSPYNDAPPPSERELARLRDSMREAKAVLAAWSSQATKGAGLF